ncbi:MAG: hypothetical protein R3A79_13140 [Nannocystaceae bacterium]
MRPLAWLLALPVSVACVGCDRTPPTAVPGAKYTLIRGEIPFYDGGCSQQRGADGKIIEGTAFFLVEEDDGCWLITLMDEVDTYIRPNADLIQSKRTYR